MAIEARIQPGARASRNPPVVCSPMSAGGRSMASGRKRIDRCTMLARKQIIPGIRSFSIRKDRPSLVDRIHATNKATMARRKYRTPTRPLNSAHSNPTREISDTNAYFSILRRIFPTLDFGSSSLNAICFGFL